MRKRNRIASTGLSSDVLRYLLKRGHTQVDVARILDVTEGYISLVKSQERSFTLDHLIRLAQGIKMPLGEFLIQVTDRPNASGKTREMLDGTARVMRLADEAREAIRQHQMKKRPGLRAGGRGGKRGHATNRS